MEVVGLVSRCRRCASAQNLFVCLYNVNQRSYVIALNRAVCWANLDKELKWRHSLSVEAKHLIARPITIHIIICYT